MTAQERNKKLKTCIKLKSHNQQQRNKYIEEIVNVHTVLANSKIHQVS